VFEEIQSVDMGEEKICFSAAANEARFITVTNEPPFLGDGQFDGLLDSAVRHRLLQLGLVDGELDGAGGGLGAQVIHSSLEAALPGVEMQSVQLRCGGLVDVQIEALALIDERATVRRHVDDGALADLPHRLVEVLDVVGDALDVLDRTVVGNDHISHLRIPKAKRDKIFDQILVDHREISGKDSSVVNIRGVGLEAFIVAQNLGGRGGGHGSNKEAVPEAMFRNRLLQTDPIPTWRRGHTPEIILKNSLGRWRALK